MKILSATLLLLAAQLSMGILQSRAFAQAEMEDRQPPNAQVLKDEQWKQIDGAIKRGLAWLLTQQKADGSFDSPQNAQPAITSFCLMAFLAKGESPADGKYKEQLQNALEFIATQQKANGLIATTAPNEVPIPRIGFDRKVSTHSVYNHAISGLALAEAYGQCSPEQSKRLAPVIEKAIAATLEMQRWGGKRKPNQGGWRYLSVLFPNGDSDLSATGWQLMFLRSAKNAGFDVPQKSIEAAVKYVENSFLKDQGGQQVHAYLTGNPRLCTRAMAGAGVLALAHAGKHESKEAVASGEWILKHNFNNYNDDAPIYGISWLKENYHYASFLCSQAMFQLGGKYWKQFFPPLVETLLANQQAEGQWPPERGREQLGSCYSTSLCILSMSVPTEILPIFQR